jgi:hypothetical protein
MLDWLEKHPGLASWLQFVGSVAAIWYAVRIASWTERRQSEQAWKTVVTFGNELVDTLSKLHSACVHENLEWIQRFPHVLDDLVELGQAIPLQHLPGGNIVKSCCGLRRTAAEAKGQLEMLRQRSKGKQTTNFADARMGFSRLLRDAREYRGYLVLIKHAVSSHSPWRTRTQLLISHAKKIWASVWPRKRIKQNQDRDNG